MVASSLAKARKRRQQELLAEVAHATAKLITTTLPAAAAAVQASDSVSDVDAVAVYRRWHAALLHGALDNGNSDDPSSRVKVHTIARPIAGPRGGSTTAALVTGGNAVGQSLSSLLSILDERGDGDGRISKSELNDWFGQVAGERSSALMHKVAPFFDRADVNSDGFVEPLELSASASSSHFGLAILLRRIAATVQHTELRA